MIYIKQAVIAFLFINLIHAQNSMNQVFDSFGRGNSFIIINPDTDKIIDESDIEGSKYLNDYYQRAEISTYPNQVFFIRYNLLTDQMEFQGKDGVVYVFNSRQDDVEITFVNINKTYKSLMYIDKNNKVSGYFLPLNDGKHEILKKQKVVYVEKKASKTGYDKARPAEFKRLSEVYFIKTENADLVVEMPKNKKKFAALFPEDKLEILNFIKTNNIKLSKDSDLIKLINYINSI